MIALISSARSFITSQPLMIDSRTWTSWLRMLPAITIEPMQAFPLIKDLVTDVSWNYEVKQKIQPFAPRPPPSRCSEAAQRKGLHGREAPRSAKESHGRPGKNRKH